MHEIDVASMLLYEQAGAAGLSARAAEHGRSTFRASSSGSLGELMHAPRAVHSYNSKRPATLTRLRDYLCQGEPVDTTITRAAPDDGSNKCARVRKSTGRTRRFEHI